MRPTCANANSTSRAGSPLLFGLAPRGVFRASRVATRAVGSYPTFSPLPRRDRRAATPNESKQLEGVSQVFPARCHRAALRRRYIFCGTFRERIADANRSLRQLSRSPGVTRRVALYPELAVRRAKGLRHRPLRAYDDGVRTFLPPGHLAMARPAITRLTRYLYCTPDSHQVSLTFVDDRRPSITGFPRAEKIRCHCFVFG